ncbi:MAG: hypothetical protein AAFY60_08675 [Myxococcota bacterium]
MRVPIAVVLTSFASVYGCGDCDSSLTSITIDVSNSARDTPSPFAGVITLAGESYGFECPAERFGDDIGLNTDETVRIGCGPEGLSLTLTDFEGGVLEPLAVVIPQPEGVYLYASDLLQITEPDSGCDFRFASTSLVVREVPAL